jgi:predicted dinucleotide-binding enzyme
VFSYSRRYEKLETLAREAGGRARAGSPLEAAREADAILLAVHWSRLDDVLGRAGDLSGKVIVSCCVPLNIENTELVVAHTSSGAEVIAKKVPGARVIAAFQAVPSEVFFNVFEARQSPTRPSLVYCGDDANSKWIAAQLIRDVGFDPVDAGALRIARYIEPFAMLIGELAYERPGGPELAYRFQRFGSQ